MENKMNKILEFLGIWYTAIRAASLARRGRYDEAADLYRSPTK